MENRGLRSSQRVLEQNLQKLQKDSQAMQENHEFVDKARRYMQGVILEALEVTQIIDEGTVEQMRDAAN